MSVYTSPAMDSQQWLSPNALHDLLTLIAPGQPNLPPVASSEINSYAHQEQFRSMASCSTDSPSSSCDALSKYWRPCTGELTIGNVLEACQFPVSFRDLVYRWEEAGSPELSSFRIPLGARSESISAAEQTDLQSVTEVQEQAVITAIDSYFQQGFVTPQSKTFVTFASYLDIYTAVHVELMALQEDWDLEQQASVYQSTWRKFLNDWDSDRSACAGRESHDCLTQLLWGEVYDWPLTEIKRSFKAYKMRSPSGKRRVAASEPTSPIASRHRRSAVEASWSSPMQHTSESARSSRSGTAALSSPWDDMDSNWTQSSTQNSPLASYSSRTSYDDVSCVSQEPKQWLDSSLLLQAMQDMTTDPSNTNVEKLIKRRHSRSSSHPPPMLSQPHGFAFSPIELGLSKSSTGSPHRDMLAAQYTAGLTQCQDQVSAANSKLSCEVDSTTAWTQYQSLLQHAAVQLDTAAELLSAQAMTLRSCSANQQQWQAYQADQSLFVRPPVRRNHTNVL